MIDYTRPLDELPDPLPIEPLRKPFDVTITPPGSKSITCRAYVLAALAEGESRIIRPLRAEDTDLLLEALCTLGAEARWVPGAPGQDGEDVLIKGVGGRFPRGGRVYLVDGGTPTRFMIAVACLAREPVVVDASPRMRERPIAEGVDMLRTLGATIEYIEEEGRLPVRVVPSERFKGGELTVGKTASSQFISALMLIAPWLEVGVQVRSEEGWTSESYLDLTAGVLEDWGCDVDYVERKDETIGYSVRGGPLQPLWYEVEIDASSAVYWLAARSLVPRAWIRIASCSTNGTLEEWGYLSLQPDSSFYHDVLELEQAATREYKSWRDPLMMSCHLSPDSALMVAALAVGLGVHTKIIGLHTLRMKETDRIAALAFELRKVGCEVETTDDSITITPPEAARDDRREERADHADAGAGRSASSSLRSSDAASDNAEPIVIETYNDHRMAMSFAILGLVRPGLAIRNPACVRKSYPTFWRDFAKLYE